MQKVNVYTGDLVFSDVSITTAVNTYFAYMFGGFLRKMGCATRPYENIKGSTEQVIQDSMEIFYAAFLNKTSKEEALIKVIQLFENIPVTKTERPKVAIFGDLYVRDNDVINQNIIQTIEENGGEVITTPYSEYGKIVIAPYIKKWIKEGSYSYALRMKVLGESLKLLEKKYYKYFNRILKKVEPTLMESIENQIFDFKNFLQETKITDLMERIIKSLRGKKMELSFKKTKSTIEEKLSKFHVNINQSGESMDNILKIMSLVEHHPDISLFVQTNPAFCCPSLVTEAMASHIEKITGIPIATITYDGTGGFKNQDLIPYLKYPRINKINMGEKAN